jgi:hypothetical protein|tara:strand:- start:2588 stop:3427 length:840 start_codon:yes stop_codon:yes gene_type:complete
MPANPTVTPQPQPEPEPETQEPPPRILKVRDPPSHKIKPLHPHLPQPPSCVLMVSPVKTGKSTIISNLLLNEGFYGHEYFDDVFIISNTINNDQTSRFVKEHFDCEDHYTDQMIDDLVLRQTSYKKKDQPEVALILDDILGSLKSGSRVNTLSARFRHYNIKLLLFSTQVFRYVSNIVRQNTTNLIVGSPFPNRKELHKVAEEFGDIFGGPKQFLKIYALCTPERYDFMHCDLQANPPLAYRCFDYVVAEGDKIVGGGGVAPAKEEVDAFDTGQKVKGI